MLKLMATTLLAIVQIFEQEIWANAHETRESLWQFLFAALHLTHPILITSLYRRWPQSPSLTPCLTVPYPFHASWLVAGHNVDSKNVDSHNVEVIMSKSQNVDNGNGESQNVESVTHTRFRTLGPIGVRNVCHACYQSDVFSLLYLCFNFIA